MNQSNMNEPIAHTIGELAKRCFLSTQSFVPYEFENAKRRKWLRAFANSEAMFQQIVADEWYNTITISGYQFQLEATEEPFSEKQYFLQHRNTIYWTYITTLSHLGEFLIREENRKYKQNVASREDSS